MDDLNLGELKLEAGGLHSLDGIKGSDRATAEDTSAEHDRRLVAAVIANDRKATAEFVTRHTDSVYAYIHHRLIPRADLVDDFVQEVFLAAWKNLGQFQGTSSLKAWMLGIARHKVETYYRARLRQTELLDETDSSGDFRAAVEEPQFDEFLDRQRLLQKTRKTLESLPERYSLVLLWRYWEQRSAREMARAIGKSEKAVERILARAREHFKRRWRSE